MMPELINAARAAANVAPLRENALLSRAAKGHAADLAAHQSLIDNWLYHQGSNGSSIYTRMVAEGYAPSAWAESVGWGWDGDDETMLAWWLASAVHRPMFLSAKYDEVGIGFVEVPGSHWRFYWCVKFAKGKSTYTSHIPVVAAPKPSDAVDLVDYLRGDGRAYRVGNGWGSYEVFQTQSSGNEFYQVKAWDDLSVVNWEGFSFDDTYIRRDVDTSPGGGRFYRQFGAPWVRRFMRPGERFSYAKRLQFYRLDDCQPVEQHSGDVVDTIEFVAHHARFTFPARDWEPVSLDDVVELRWTAGERYWFARGYGLVGWRRDHDDPHSPAWSAISEMRPGVGVLRRLDVRCL